MLKMIFENLEEDGEEDCGEDDEGNEGELKAVDVEVDHEFSPDGGVDGHVVGVGCRVWDHLNKMNHLESMI